MAAAGDERALAALTEEAAASVFPLMVLVALQVGVQPAVTRACVSEAVSGQSLVLAEMMVSMVLALHFIPPGTLGLWSPSESLLLAAPPAAAYAVRSLVKQAAYRRCDGVTFNVLNQTKVVFCAVAAWVMLGEGQTAMQCLALLCAVAAGALLVYQGQGARGPGAAGKGSAANDDDDYVAKSVKPEPGILRPVHSGVLQVCPARPCPNAASKASGALLALATAACSGVAAAMSQAAMRKSERHSALFNLELVLWGAPLVALTGGVVRPAAALRGWQGRTLVPVILQAAGGLLVSAVVKRQGGVAMGLCTVAGIAVSAVVDAARTNRLPSRRQIIAATLCAVSVYVHQMDRFPAWGTQVPAHHEAQDEPLRPVELPTPDESPSLGAAFVFL